MKDKHLYEKLRDEGDSEEKSARMANAAANTSRKGVGARAAAGTTETGQVPEL